MTDFEVMGKMSKENKDIKMSGNIVSLNKTKGGFHLTMGIDEATGNQLMKSITEKPTHYVAVYIINKDQFDKIKNT